LAQNETAPKTNKRQCRDAPTPLSAQQMRAMISTGSILLDFKWISYTQKGLKTNKDRSTKIFASHMKTPTDKYSINII